MASTSPNESRKLAPPGTMSLKNDDTEDISKKHKRLQVGIVGAGIAGLCAAIALRRAGHDVEVFERSHFRQEVGAAITITPNAGRILQSWGFDVDAARGSERLRALTVDAVSLEPVAQGLLRPDNGESVHAYHRADLHNELRHIAKAQEGDGAPVKINLGREVFGVDVEHTQIQLRSEVFPKDLVICADGIKSTTLAGITGNRSPARYVGRAVYRTLINMDRIKKEPYVWQVFERYGWPSIDTPINLQGTRCDIYPCKKTNTISVAIYHVSRPQEGAKTGWSSPATTNDVLEALEGMHAFFSLLVKHADHINCYTVDIKEPATSIVNRSTAIIGDAAHAMQPLHAQGACMCVEDAAALQVLFDHFEPVDNVQLRLRLFNQLRLPRITVSVLFSNAMYYQSHTDEWLLKMHQYYSGSIPSSIAPWTPETQAFFWNYDAFKEAHKALRFKRSLGGIPVGAIAHFGLHDI